MGLVCVFNSYVLFCGFNSCVVYLFFILRQYFHFFFFNSFFFLKSQESQSKEKFMVCEVWNSSSKLLQKYNKMKKYIFV